MDEPAHVASTRAVYDHSADLYVETVGAEVTDRFEAPLDRAVLGAFAETLTQRDRGLVLDAGCGPGRVAAFLARRGLNVRGVDLSSRMIHAARTAHPTITFEQGSLTYLGVPARSLAGAVYWYSIIATPPIELPAVWHELGRAAAPGAQVLVAFQSGQGEAVERPDAYGSSTVLTLYRHSVEDVISSLEASGFELRADIRRQPEFAHETTPQAFLLCTWGGIG